jgi:hypothetical protein
MQVRIERRKGKDKSKNLTVENEYDEQERANERTKNREPELLSPAPR